METNIHEAKSQLSRLIARAVSGEEVTIARAGVPVVRLVPIKSNKPKLGTARGLITMKPGWDAPLTPAELKNIFGL